MPIAYEPQDGYKYQILCKKPSYDTAWEHCDYAKDFEERKHLINKYQLAYGHGYMFRFITLPYKYWPKN